MFPILGLVFFLCLSGLSAAALVAARHAAKDDPMDAAIDESRHHGQVNWHWFRSTIAIAAMIFMPAQPHAQMAPARAWPQRNFWVAQLFDEPDGGPTYCAMHAENYQTGTLHVLLLQMANGNHGVVVVSTQQTREIPASKMDFASDGFSVMSLPAMSKYSRQLDGTMGNTVAAKPDLEQWEKLWQVFRHSGVVTIRTTVATVNAPTQGFELASADFEQSAAAWSVALNVPASAVRQFVIRRIFEAMTLVEERPRADHRRTRSGKGKGESPHAPNFDSERLPEPVRVSLPEIRPERHVAAFREAMEREERIDKFGEWK